MGIEKYRIEVPPAFEKYYDAFLRNSLLGKGYRITLTTGESIVGIPRYHPSIDSINPHFVLHSIPGYDLYRIPFAVLEKAEEMHE